MSTLAACLALVVVACSAERISTTTTTTIGALSADVAPGVYLALVTPANRAFDTFARGATAWTTQTTGARAADEARPLITVLQDLRQGLLLTAWPATIRHDANMLAADVARLVGDLRDLVSVNFSYASRWEASFARDASALRAADNTLRRALGLPPLSNGGVTTTPTTLRDGGDQPPPTPPPTTAGAGGGTGGSCFGCVTITTVTWGFHSAPGTLSTYQNCIPRNATVASNTKVAGPGFNPLRQFTYTASFTIGCNLPDGVEVSVGKIDLRGSSPPISILATNPGVPFVVPTGTTQALSVTFHALDGNVYNGPLVIDVILD